jgi:imidazolonepropionase-like amidohydrolase
MKFIFMLLLPLQLFAQQNGVLFKNVNVVDVKTGHIATKQNVLITGNIIQKITSKAISSKNASIVDGTGKYLIPGLWDMHVHVFRNAADKRKEYYFPLLIANGVTSVRDMWTKPKNMPYVSTWRQQVSTSTGMVPRFATVGTLVDGTPPVWPGSDTVKTAEEARDIVHKIKDSGVDFVKVYGRLSREAYFAIVDECKKLNFPFAGHLPESVSFTEAATSGQKSIEHLISIFSKWKELSTKEETFKNIKRGEWTPALRFELLQSFSEQKTQELAKLLARNGTSLCPTIVVHAANMFTDDKKYIQDERLQYISEEEKKGWMDFYKAFKPENRSINQLRFQTDMKYLNIMYKTGVKILAGTDLGNPFIYAGFSLHDELEHFAKAGLTPLDALQTATLNPAKYVGKEREIGTVSIGKLADLILLDANPLLDITNTRKINAVVLNGKLLQRKDLDVLLKVGKESAIQNY